jgi:hypothetical protein
MVCGQIRPNALSQDSVVAEQLHQYNVKPAMLPHNVLLLLVAHLPDPVHDQVALHLAHIGQVALHPAHIGQVDMGHAPEDVLQAHQCADNLNDAFQ